MKINLTITSLLCFAALSLSGCANMFAQTVVVLIGGAQHSHEYYLHYTADFQVGGYPVHLDQYGDVWSYYENFNGTKCDRSQPHCWQHSSGFVVGLPNGDVALIGDSDEALDLTLSTLKPGEVLNTTLYVSIYRDQPMVAKAFEGQMSCQFISKDIQANDYGWPRTPLYQRVVLPSVEAKVERVDSIPGGQESLDRQLKASGNLLATNIKPITCESILEQSGLPH